MNNENTDSTLKLICEFQLKSLTETANGLAKGMAFYLAIMAVITGYVLSQRAPPATHQVIIGVGFAVSFIFTTAASAIAWGLHKGIKDYEKSLKRLNHELVDELGVHLFIRRGMKVVWVVIICAFLVLMTFILGMIIITISGYYLH